MNIVTLRTVLVQFLELCVVYCVFTTLSRVWCALIGKIIDIINRMFNLVISTKIKNFLITYILICKKGKKKEI